MRDDIEAGSLLIETGTLLPDSWLSRAKPYSGGWASVSKLNRAELESSIQTAGWTFFYLAGEIKATALGLDDQDTAGKAIDRLTKDLRKRRLNCLEISRVTADSFLGVPYTSVAGHARHIQEGPVLLRADMRPAKPGSSLADRPDQRHQPGD
jgi:hypothetical protein